MIEDPEIFRATLAGLGWTPEKAAAWRVRKLQKFRKNLHESAKLFLIAAKCPRAGLEGMIDRDILAKAIAVCDEMDLGGGSR